MENKISLQSVVPIRLEPSEKVEIITQLLFGETFLVLETFQNWIRIKMEYDNYEGWISENMCHEFKKPLSKRDKICIRKEYQLISKNGSIQRLSPGSELPNYDYKTATFQVDEISFQLKEKIPPKNQVIDIASTARYFLNTPYLWGGRSIWGIDCSGLVQLVFKINDIKLPRDTYEQVKVGENVSFISEIKEGDLAFFENKEGEIIHVGICLKNNQIIHAHGSVRIDVLDHNGIYNLENSEYSHKLRVIRRPYTTNTTP